MKKFIFSTWVLLIILKLSAQTTNEEYNYITKGYKVQTESGLDMKKGYEFIDIDYVPLKNPSGSIIKKVWLKSLNRVSENGTKTIAAYMIIYEKVGSEKQYICIPSPNSPQSMIDGYFTSLAPGILENADKLQLIAFMLSRSLKW